MSNFSLSASQRELMKRRRSGCGAQGGASARSSSSSSITDTVTDLLASAGCGMDPAARPVCECGPVRCCFPRF